MRRVCVVGTAAVVPGLLDRLLACDRSTRDLLFSSLDRRRRGVPVGVLHDPLAHHDDRADEREWEQDANDAPHEVRPEVAECRTAADEAADQSNGDGETNGRRGEVLHRERDHLGEVAHRRFAGVVLPVRVRHEAHRGVERQRRIRDARARRSG